MLTSVRKNKSNLKCRYLLYTLILILVFEGLIRKIVPSSIGIIIFFIKDALCIVGISSIIKFRSLQSLAWLSVRWKLLIVAFLPLILYTILFDPILGVFAAKQYLLYTTVAFLIPISFPNNTIKEFKSFIAFFSTLLIPTTLVAILQNSLPASHWLNLSVAGDSLEGFSAGGFLRVSSTFSFNGQYAWFLNAICAFTMIRYFLYYDSTKNRTIFQIWLMPLLLSCLLIVGTFITGSRTAVLGNIACLILGFIFIMWHSPSVFISRGLLFIFVSTIVLFTLRATNSEFFAAYDLRSQGYNGLSHNEEIQERMLGGFFGWTNWFWNQDPASVFLGNGLGVMSNGSDKISYYAKDIRQRFWTEADMPTTAWEGGIYLLLVWYGFRFSVIVFCFRLWINTRKKELKYSISFLLANVIITGIIGTIGMQPPIAIWWWLSIGCIITLHNLDCYEGNHK